MEEVWEDPSGLSDFLGMKIDRMHDNVYFPERGTSRPEIEGLRDQWSSDMQDLSDDDLQYGRNKLCKRRKEGILWHKRLEPMQPKVSAVPEARLGHRICRCPPRNLCSQTPCTGSRLADQVGCS